MKKLAIFSVLALCLGFSSCDNVDLPNPPGQSNPQEALFDAANLMVRTANSETTVIDLTAFNNESRQVPLAMVTLTGDLPSGYALKFAVSISKDGNFDNAPVIECECPSTTVFADPDMLNGVLRTFSKDVADQTVQIQLRPYIYNTANHTSMVEVDRTFGPFTMVMKPFEPTTVIENSYYLLLSADGSTWNLADAIASTHSSTNVYDDPEFKFNFYIDQDQIDNGGVWWKVIPASTYAMADAWTTGAWYGTTDDEQPATEGTLVAAGAIPGINMMISGPIMMSINMETLHFNYLSAIECYYTPGGSNGWNASNSQALWTNDYSFYFGFVAIDGEFKFNPDTDWKGRDFGVKDQPEFSTGEYPVGKGKALGSDNIKVPVNGLYYVTLTPDNDNAFELRNIGRVGIIGSATPTDWSDDTALTPSADFLTWTGTIKLTEGELKFRFNGSWDLSLGGTADNLSTSGGNIASPGDGTYEVTVSFATYPYQAIFVKK